MKARNNRLSVPVGILLVMLVISCYTRQSDSQVLDFGNFKLKTPAGWAKIKKAGIDSYTGGLTNETDTLWFDYGLYGVDFSEEENQSYLFANDTVNGLEAIVTIPDSADKGNISMHIPRVIDKNKFTILGSEHHRTQSST